jgi:hypothetical protein
MSFSQKSEHASLLDHELRWLSSCIQARFASNELPAAPLLSAPTSSYANFVQEAELQDAERIVLILALSVHLNKNILTLGFNDDTKFLLGAMIRSEHQNQLLPTFETALYILAGDDNLKRFSSLCIFDTEHVFYKKSVLDWHSVKAGESVYNRMLSLSLNHRDLFINNMISKPKFTPDFPAELVETNMEWLDMVLPATTAGKLMELKDDLDLLRPMIEEWKMQLHAVDGCRVLFHGESGTGKTLAAKLIGKYLNQDVYRVDISLIASKYIGETSKRLKQLFDTAESKGWILFFDEGDALFGQRQTSAGGNGVSQYANQDTAYLLQRIENYDGVIIVASNLQANIDVAFTRRFEHIIKFEGLDAELQHQLWLRVLPESVSLASGIKLADLVKRYSLSPAAITKTAQRVCRMTYKKKSNVIDTDDFLLCLKDAQLKTKGRAGFAKPSNMSQQ